MTQQHLELIQLLFLLAYVLKSRGQETLLTRTAFLWWVAVLVVDIFVWHCDRPDWMRLGLNSIDMLIGWLIIYEKYRNPCKHVLQAILALVSSLVR